MAPRETGPLSGPETSTGKTPWQMRAELARLFHPDVKGGKGSIGTDSHELMIQLNSAYDQALKGNVIPLEQMFSDWATNARQEAATVQEKMAALLKEESDRLFLEAKKKGLKSVRAIHLLREHYSVLCSENNFSFDEEFLMKFLYDEGWIKEETFLNFRKDKKPPRSSAWA